MQYKKNILLVDDDSTLIKLLNKQLQLLNYIVFTACSGAEAINLIEKKENQIDLIIMDIVFKKGPDGIEIAQRILNKFDIPIIFHSAYSEKILIEKLDKVTSYGFISKPSELTVIDASIKIAFNLFENSKMLKESQNHIKSIINSTSDFIWSVDAITYNLLKFRT